MRVNTKHWVVPLEPKSNQGISHSIREVGPSLIRTKFFYVLVYPKFFYEGIVLSYLHRVELYELLLWGLRKTSFDHVLFLRLIEK